MRRSNSAHRRWASRSGSGSGAAAHHLVLVRDVRDDARQELQRVHRLGTGRRPVALVGALAHRRAGAVVGEALEGHRISGTVARKPLGERCIAFGQSFLYSVPHSLIREQVDVRSTTRTIEVFHRGKRVAAHQRRYGGRRHGTDPDHMPSAHRRYAEWTPERFRRRARSIGPSTEGLVVAVLANRPHP